MDVDIGYARGGDRPPNGVMDRLNCDIALEAAIALPLLLPGLGLLPGLSPTAPATKTEPRVLVGVVVILSRKVANRMPNSYSRMTIHEQICTFNKEIYYDRMSELLDALIEKRRQQAISYQEYLEQVKQLAGQVKPGATQDNYPNSMDTQAKRSLYDNLGQDEALALRIDTAVRYTKKADWIGNKFKEREVARAVREESAGYNVNLDQVMELLKNQREYQ